MMAPCSEGSSAAHCAVSTMQKRRSKMFSPRATSVAVSMLLLSVACAKGVAQEADGGGAVGRTVVVSAKPPSVRDLPIRLSYTAEIQPIQAADIKSVEARGFIRTIRVDKGDRVKKGQVLVTVDCPDFRSRRRQAEEEIRNILAVKTNAERILGRLKLMRDQKLIAQMELDGAQANFDAASARLQNAKERLSEVDELIAYCTMRAPFHGEVSARHRDPGAPVRPGDRPILTIMRIDAVRVWVNVVERDAPYVKLDLPAELIVQGLPDKKFSGKVTRFVKGFDPRTRTLLTEIEIANPDGHLKPGMFGRVTLLVESRPKAVMVPATAVLTQECLTQERQMCSWVYVVRSDCKGVSGPCTRRREVSVGYASGEEVEIRKGVAPEDNVVYSGRDLVADGTPVRLLQ